MRIYSPHTHGRMHARTNTHMQAHTHTHTHTHTDEYYIVEVDKIQLLLKAFMSIPLTFAAIPNFMENHMTFVINLTSTGSWWII